MTDPNTGAAKTMNPPQTLIDHVTGNRVPNIGAEENRQAVERLLVEEKRFSREEIGVGVPIAFTAAGEVYRSRIDLVVSLDGRPLMVIKCAAGSLGSREREAASAARLIDTRPLPLAAVSDGKTAIVFDVATGKPIGTGLEAIPDRAALARIAAAPAPAPLSAERLNRERLIFRSYDSMNVNRPPV